MYDIRFHVRSLENYAYYFKLIHGKQQRDAENAPGNGQDSMMQQQSEKDGTDQGGGAPGQEQAEEGNEIVTAANCGELTDHNWEAGDDAEDAQAVVREFVNSAVDMMNEESRGLMPAHFMSQVELINKPPVLSWQAILKKYIGTISANKRKTRMRLNRRQPERFDLSGRVDDKVLKIAVAIDTSGSVDDHMIAQIFNEIFAILAKRKHEITVIECDAQVQRVYRAKNAGEIQKKVAGRGGTMFTPAIEYINNDKYFRDALLIYFTDGFGEREIPKPKTYRNLWVVFDDERHLSVKEPYGVVLKL
jgi:predicted metal-dependent peptidase